MPFLRLRIDEAAFAGWVRCHHPSEGGGAHMGRFRAKKI